MGKIENFEDLDVWQLSMELAQAVYSATHSEKFSKDFGLRDQIRRCSVSVPSNISEGFERNSTNQFVYFPLIAKGSCGECRTQLILAFRLGYIEQQLLEALNQQCLTVSKQLGGFISYLKGRKPNK